MNPILKGHMVRWNRVLSTRPTRTLIRANQGIQIGDIGLVIDQNVTELKILIKDQLVFFHTMEVEVVQ